MDEDEDLDVDEDTKQNFLVRLDMSEWSFKRFCDYAGSTKVSCTGPYNEGCLL